MRVPGSRLDAVPAAASGLAFLVAGLVLAGWTWDIEPLKRALPGLVSMNPMAAVAFSLAGISLWLQRTSGATIGRRRLALLAAAAVAAIGLLKLAALASGWDAGVDQWLYAGRLDDDDPVLPNQIALNTALGFVLLGSALLTLDVTSRRGRRPAEVLASAVLVIALLAIVGYAYGIDDVAEVARLMPMAPTAAALFLVLALAVFAARTHAGIMAVVVGPGPGGAMARLLLPGMALTLLALGWLRLEGELRGFYGAEMGVVIYTVTNIVLFAALIWRSASSLYRADNERTRLTAQQRQSEERTRAIIETASDAFIAIDAAGLVTDWNRQAEATFGWSREEAIGRRLSELILPVQHRAAHEHGLRRFAATGEGPVLNRRIEITALRRDGGEFPVELAIWPVRSDGTHTFNAFVRDITERKQAEDVLTRFAAIVESSDDAIMSKTLDGIITHWNPAAERMFGYTAQEAIGQPMAMLIPPERADEEPRILALIGRGERVEHSETVRMRKDGTRIDISATISPVKDRASTIAGASTIARDITEAKQAERSILALNAELATNAEQLQQTNRELEAFSYTISHDLRAPLRHIDGYARMLQEDAGEQLDADMRRYLDAIGDAARQMGALIDDLLAFSRLGRKPTERTLVDMRDLVARAAQELGVGDDGPVMVGSLPAAQADPVLLKQVWINLLSNALKYSAPRGDEARVEVTGEDLGDLVRYRIRDNGVGFDMRYADKLFGVFQRLHSHDEFEGTGVGLAIVQRIVTRHGGTIVAEAEPGRGATFTFELPVAEQVSDEPDVSAASAKGTPA